MKNARKTLVALALTGTLALPAVPAAEASRTTCVRLDFIKVCRTAKGKYVKKCTTTYLDGMSVTKCKRQRR